MRAARCAPGSCSRSSPATRRSRGGSCATCGDRCRAAPVLVALTDAAAARAEGVAELLELRVDERRGTLFFGRGDDGLVIVVPAGDRDPIDEIAERFEVRIGVSDPVVVRRVRGGRRSGARRARPRHGHR